MNNEQFNNLRGLAYEVNARVRSGEAISSEDLRVLKDYAQMTSRNEDIIAFTNGKSAVKQDDKQGDAHNTNNPPSQVEGNNDVETLQKELAAAAEKAKQTSNINDLLEYTKLKERLREVVSGQDSDM